jgi:Mn-dependent DtxR family transcriptional regulator
MEFLTIKEQKVLIKLKEYNQLSINFNVVSKSSVADFIGVKRPNLYKYIAILTEKGYIKYIDNIITYI